jgi:hypothetical protein
MEILIAGFQQGLDGLAKQTGDLHARAANTMSQSAESLRGYCRALEQGLAGLNSVLEQLGQHQVVIQAPERRRGWFRRK